MKNHILDEKDRIIKNDPQNMLSCIDDLALQIHECWQDIKKFIIPAHYVSVKNVIILGMGGSGIGGGLAKSYLERNAKIPVSVLRDYELPKYIDRTSLVIASSYSGNTEETISAFKEASSRGCKLLAITSGGEIKNIAIKYNAPVFNINYNSQPRAALGYSLTAILGIFAKLAIIKIDDALIEEIIEDIRKIYTKINLDVVLKKNQAKDIAVKMHQHYPVIIGSGYLAEVACRIKTQINENAKQIAYYDILPELNHNSIVGLDYPDDLKNRLFVLLLQSKYDHQRIKIRQQILVKILAKKKIKFETLFLTQSNNPLCEMFKMIFFGDYISYYLSVLNNVDPTPVEIIKFLKEKLATYK